MATSAHTILSTRLSASSRSTSPAARALPTSAATTQNDSSTTGQPEESRTVVVGAACLSVVAGSTAPEHAVAITTISRARPGCFPHGRILAISFVGTTAEDRRLSNGEDPIGLLEVRMDRPASPISWRRRRGAGL